MGLSVQTLNHNTPSAPTRTLGMMLGASGVSAPSIQSIGVLTGASSADGSFSGGGTGYGQIDYDTSGYMYVADHGNNRIQRFAKNSSGVWTYDSKLGSITTLLGGGSNPVLLAIDRSRNQIHVAAYDHYTASNWISVWNLSNWPTLTTGNRVRQYGANAASNTAGRALTGISLTVDDTYAVVTSYGSPFRLLRWNHVTGALQNEETQINRYAQFATDGAGNWWCSAESGAAEGGLYKIDTSTFTGSARLDTALISNIWRAKRFFSLYVSGPFYYSGRVYARDIYGRLFGFDSTSNTYQDTFIDPGSLEPSGVVTGKLGGQFANSDSIRDKGSVVVDADGCGWFMCWAHNADNTATQDFLLAWPLSTSTATWTKTDWSSGTNTLSGILLDGTNLSAEKFKLRLRKNSGSWITVRAGSLLGSAFTTAISGLGTFTSGDTLTVELSLSTWDRLDGHSTLIATRDKLSPTNVAMQLVYEDTAANVYVPYESGAILAKLGGTGAFRAKIGG